MSSTRKITSVSVRSFGVDKYLVRKYLNKELARLLPELRLYKLANSGLEFSVTTGEMPWCIIISWQFAGKNPDNRMQDKIIAKLKELVCDSNLFVFVANKDWDGKIELRLEDHQPFLVRDEEPFIPNPRDFD